MKKIIIFIVVFIFAYWGCETDPIIDPLVSGNEITVTPEAGNTPDTGNLSKPRDSVKGTVLFTFNDFDGNVYHAVQIGRQVWSQENLKTTHYNDGTQISCIKGTSGWNSLKTGAYCHYQNDVSTSDIYGLLYNYYAVASNKLAPEGWHVATFADWEVLLTEVYSDVGNLTNADDWKEPFYDLNDNRILCTNSTCFTALPNGYRDFSVSPGRPEFDCLGVQASWWTSTKGTLGVNGMIIYLDGTFGVFPRGDRPGDVGSGIRLVKNAD